jgi:ABC-type transport system involved in cytochrome bd biosynthesis fused ATPase/permease subunit
MSIRSITPSVNAATPAPVSARQKSPWPLAIVLAVVASASGLLLTGVSAWFLGAVALAGLGPAALAFNFHTPAALVRLFALTKTLGKYGERVAGHRAALLDQVKRRTRLFLAMAQAPATRTAGWQLGNQDRLSDYMEDVEDIDYARLRVDMPAMVLVAGTALLAGATAWLAPLALLPIAILSIAVMAAWHRLMPAVSRQWAAIRSSQRAAGRLLGSALASVVPLQAERAFPDILSPAFSYFRNAEAGRLAQRRAFAMLDMLAGIAGPLAVLSVLVAAWQTGSRGSALLIPAFLGFGWLALGETANNISRFMLGRVREQAARDGLKDWSAVTAVKTGSPSYPAALQKLLLKSVPQRAPDGRRLGEAINLTLRAGHPTALVGASGTGKTTLLKQIAGWIGVDSEGQFVGDGVVMLGGYRRAISHFCLHDAAILSDTVRENLFAPGASDRQCWLALATVELDARIAEAGGLDAWISEDMLSLGEAQRLNLTRTLLSDAPVVLLDEPVEHLDFHQASRILPRVLSQLTNRIVVYSSHADYAALEAIKISLGADR